MNAGLKASEKTSPFKGKWNLHKGFLFCNAPLIVRLFLLLKNVCCLKSTVSEVPDTTRLGNEGRSELVPNLAVKNDSSA